MKKILIAALTLSCLGSQAQTGAYKEQANAYILKYKDMAMAEQRRSGVPAAITLAQGIYETQAGQSELATEANNHFGIKCKKEWTGETFAHTDDAPNECFRKYGKAEDSYRDHSDYLRKTPRYASCFALDATDYAGWATALKRCGYATNPRYADKLVKVVEDFHLQDYTVAALEAPTSDAPLMAATAPVATGKRAIVVTRINPATSVVASEAPATETPAADARETMKAEIAPAAPTEQIEPDTAPVYGQPAVRYGLKGFYARKGDVMLEYAIKYNLRYARLLELNDLPDAPLPADMFVYLEKKRGTGMHSTHKVMPGETMLTIAQAEGIQLKQLRTLNQMEQGEEPNPGTALQLQAMVAAKPSVSTTAPEVVAVPVYNAVVTPVTEATQTAIAVEKPATLIAADTTPIPNGAPAAAEEEDKEERETLPAVPQRPAVQVAAKTMPVQQQEAVVTEVPKKEMPVQRETPVRQQPKPTPPRTKTFTIADEMAVGEEDPANVKYSPRYVPPKSDKPAAAETATTARSEEPTVKSAAPQDEFSRLKAQLDKAVYAPKKPAKMEVSEETPEALKGRTPPTTATTAPAASASASATGYHTVKNGETAFGIAKQYGMSMKELREWNNLNFEAIKVGQKLKVKMN